MKKYIFVIIIIGLGVFIGVFAIFNKTESRTQVKMNTFVEISLNGPVWMDFDKIFKDAFLAMDETINLASRFDEKSQLSLLNQEASKHPVCVNEELYNLIEESINISKNSEGAFDITIAPLAKLWGFYKEKDILPSNEQIKETLKIVGYDNIILDKNKKTIFFKKQGVELDLSAIAKGYAVDKAIYTIKEYGIKSAIVNAGGEVCCIGRKNIFQKWNIGIRDPYDKKKIIKVIRLKDKAVATSGGYEKFVVYQNEKYSHLIDPRNGKPSKVFSNATVVADNCTLADALATAVCILGKEKADEVRRKYNVEVFIF